MSVINQMLRDLDSRQAADSIPASIQESRTGIQRDTVIVNDSEPAKSSRRLPGMGVLLAAGIFVLAAAAGAWWYLNQNVLPPRKMDQVKVPAIAAPAIPVIAVAPASVPSVAASSPVPVVPVSPPSIALADISLRMDSNFDILPSPEKAAKKAAKPKAVSTPRFVPERSLNDRSRTASVMKPTSPASATATARPPGPPVQSPALEALAQAQSLWNSGSHESAMDLMREALASAERADLVGTPAGNNSVLASLARELARMELADGQVRQALEMLTRLEPALSGVADVWALRGNAAQRLGRHQESAAAYRMALKLRPDEPRWLLGAAVSLAAQGQLAAAAELAEKARAGGALSPEVTTYLRQLGVPLR